ncbi:MAG: MurT ligase domain-containing protein [Oscillospiraceae bacterium]|nr:MurT ligase domain-containing protein [Oscillospiraceae bacterium]
MKFQVFLAVLACKLARFSLRLLGRGGTDFPGRVALKICPNLLGTLARNVTTVIVTGTNGKTTTSRMIEQAVADSGISYFANKSGANLISGITAEFAMHASLSGKCRCKVALIESDEAAFKAVSRYVDAKLIVVTNVFRDQLDRYGEVTHTLENIKIGVANSKNATLCLNADDSLSSSIAGEVENPVLYYGVNVPIYQDRVHELSDAPYCIRCKHEYVYDYVTYGHLGSFRCPSCGYQRQEPQLAVTHVVSSDAERSEVVFSSDGASFDAVINLPGGYNIYNACAAMACAKALGLELQLAAHSLSTFGCGFGRMEKFEIRGTEVRMILIKNPAGCNQVLNFLANTAEPSVFAVCLNDRAQDGKDISWIWDVDFEKLAQMGDRLSRLLVSGVRAEDMAVRFKYAGIPTEKISVIKDYGALMETCTAQPEPVYIMPTYTAMLNLRDKISKTYGFKDFWE